MSDVCQKCGEEYGDCKCFATELKHEKKPLYEDWNTLLMRCEENEKKIKELEKRIADLEEWRKNHSIARWAHGG